MSDLSSGARPVLRFRSVDEVAETAWLPAGSAELRRAIRRAWGLARALAPRRVPPGVYEFRSVDEANAQRDEWDRTCVHATARPASAEQMGRRTESGARTAG